MIDRYRNRRRRRIAPIGPTWFQTGSRFAEFCKLNDKAQSAHNENQNSENNRSVRVELHSGVESKTNATTVGL